MHHRNAGAGSARTASSMSIALVGLLAVGCSQAESRGAPEDDGAAAVKLERTAPVRRTVPEGTSMSFRIDDSISTDRHRAGHRFTATLTSSVVDVEGTEVIAEGTPSEWIVTESTTADGRALLAIALESVRVAGTWMHVGATAVEASIDADDPDSRGESVAKVGVGTAAGALIGQILGGDTESTLVGAGAGAVVGAAVALSTGRASATIPAGSTVVVQLDEPLIIS
jgi:hypothetical protein